jgi:hypothetical protein
MTLTSAGPARTWRLHGALRGRPVTPFNGSPRQEVSARHAGDIQDRAIAIFYIQVAAYNGNVA